MGTREEANTSSLWRWIAAFVLLAIAGFIAYRLRSALYPLLFGMLLAVSAFPWVRRFERKKFSRSVATSIVFLFAGIAGGLLLFFISTQLSNLFSELFAIGPNGEKIGVAYKAFAQLELWYVELDSKFQIGSKGQEWLRDLPNYLAKSWEKVANTAGGAIQFVWTAVGSVLDLLSLLLLGPVFAFLILLDFEGIRIGLLRWVRPQNRQRAEGLLLQVEEMLGNFLRGRLLTGFFKGAGQAVLLAICGAPYPVLTGVLSWFCSFIPIVGPALAFAPTLLLLLFAGSFGNIAIVIAILALGEILEGYLLVPKIIGPGLNLNALELLIAMLVGGAALGVLGLLLAIPIAAVLKVILLDFLTRRDQGATVH